MRKINKFVSILLVWCLFTTAIHNKIPVTAFAENIKEDEITTAADDDNCNIDNSELDVRVIQQIRDEQTTIFTGKLKDYDNGAWIRLDFSTVQFFAVLDWNDSESKVIYIIPLPSDTEIDNNTDISKPSDETVNETLSNSTALTSQNSDIQCDVNLMYDGAYSEKVIIHNRQLTVPIKITNKGSTDKNIVCYIAEYDENGVLRNNVSNSTVKVEAGKSIAAQITKVFSSETKTVKIFAWNSETLQPITGAISLDETEQDYYANTAAKAQEYDITYQIKGKINTADDVDYIKFVPKTSGEYTFNCISAVNTVTALYNANQGTLKSASTSYKYLLTENQTYYLKVTGNIGDYVLSIQYNIPNEADSFDVYKFDVDTNIYKKSIKDTCDSLYSSNKGLAKQMYDEYEDILGEEAKLHRLPDFLSDHPKDLSNFDDLLNQYYGTKYEEFAAVRQKYIDLIDRYAELANSASSNTSSAVSSEIAEDISKDTVDATQNETTNSEIIPDNEPHPIIGKYTPQVKYRENIEIGDIRPGKEIQATKATPSLTVTSKTTTSITYKATFPYSSAKGNTIYLVDFNKADGLTAEYNAYESNAIYRPSGEYTISGLQPGGIYILEMFWSTDGGNSYGGENSIDRFVQLPNNASETYKTYYGGRVAARIETADRALASDSAINAWVNNMDKAYNAYKDLTGYTPYNSKKIEMKSTRDNLNDYMGITDGKNYWTVIFGYYSWGSTAFQHARAFYQGHLRRLSKGDWGDTPMHELSHVFDNDKWNFDAETLAQLKLYYVISTLNAKVYRPDRYDNDSKGWYTGDNYYTLLRSDRYLDSYDESFGNGTYASEGFASILIDIQKKIGWDAFKKTFRYFSSLSKNMNDGEKLKLFLTKLKDYSGKDVLGYINSRDTRIIESQFGIDLEYVEPEYPKVSGGGGGGGRSEINVDKGNYSVFQFTPTTSGNYYIYTSPYAGSGVSNDTYIEVYTNANLSGTPIASNDDYDGGRFSKVSIAATENTTYYIKVRHYASGQLHAELNITKADPIQPLTLDGNQDIITSSGEFALFSFTPDNVGAYSFEVGNYNGGTTACDTYIKLYDNISMTKRLGNNEKKIVANLQANHTYYLQFSGFLMSYARGRITVSQGQTLQFTKRSDSSFLYVNNPEYIANEDIIDDIGTQNYKLFEQKNVYSKNTYYQTHLAWYNSDGDARYFPQQNSFYVGIDFYNPNSYSVNVDVSNLVATENKTHLSEYANKNGENPGIITIQPYTHAQLFDYTVNKFACHRQGELPSLFIMFDFDVKKANGALIPDGQGITVSTLAAYYYENMRLKDGEENRLIYGDTPINAGEMLYGNRRLTEHDLEIKYKGIARNQSNQIDANLEFAIDDDTCGNIPFRIKDSGELINGYYPHEQTDWNVQINPINDDNEALIHTTTDNLHKFKYRFSDSKTWYFDYKHRKSNFLTEDGDGIDSINQEVPQSIINAARNDIMSGIKTAASRDGNAAEMGSWGVVYHYTVTVNNTGTQTRKIKHRVKTGAHYTLVGMRENSSATYEFKDTKTENGYQIPFEVAVPPGQKTFEIVTLCGGGDGGLENTIIVE